MGKIAFVFPGQGTQHPGMGLDLKKNDLFARFTFIQADQLRPGTSDQCFYGDAETLKQTANTQPCLFTVEMAAAQALIGQGVTPDMVAGFSLGELAALTITGGVDFENGIKMVTHRGKLMQDAAEKVDSAMIAVMKLDTAKVEELCAAYPEAYPVNYNCPGQTVVACRAEIFDALAARVADEKGRMMRLKVGGAFHTPWMESASHALAEYLAGQRLKKPDLPLYANLDARPYGENAAELLSRQVCNPVRWQQTIENMADADLFVELGAGKTLSGLIKKTLPQARVCNVEKPEDIEKLKEALGNAE